MPVHSAGRSAPASLCAVIGVESPVALASISAGRRAAFGGAMLEQGIALDFGLDEVRQLKIRQLQQLDRLLQLRRHHQLLALT